MVQEFTGIPTAPFSSVSPYARRLDLFSTPSSSTMRSSAGNNLDALGISSHLYPPTLLRPSPQKLQLNPFFPSNSSSTSNQQLLAAHHNHPDDHDHRDGDDDLLMNMHQNQMLTNFHHQESSSSLKQHHHATTNTTSSSGTATATAAVPSFDELGLSRLVGGAGFPSSTTNQEQQLLGSSQQRIFSKFNCSDFHPSAALQIKGLENVTTTATTTAAVSSAAAAAAGEGTTVGSWICPSD